MDILIIILIIGAFLFIALPFIYIVFKGAAEVWAEIIYSIFKKEE